MEKKTYKVTVPAMVRIPIQLNIPEDIGVRELARLGFMLGVEFNFKTQKLKKRKKRAK